MTPSKWSIGKISLWGALAGPPLLALRSTAMGEGLLADMPQLIGFLIGGAVAGAILFALVAAIRNFSIR